MMSVLRKQIHNLLFVFLFGLSACGMVPSAPATTNELPTAAVSSLPIVGAGATSVANIPTVPLPTAAPTATPAPTRIAMIGDFGLAGPNEAAVAALVASWQPDYVITAGDNNYPAGAAETIDDNIGQYYHAFIGNYQGNYGPGASENRFFPVLGNHDWQAPNAQPYLDYFTLPGNERYYTADLGTVRLFAIDSMPGEPDGTAADSVQGTWLKDQLAASPACWNLVTMHHAPFSSGLHGSSDWMQWPYAEWGADMVLAGHDHSYERFSHDGIPYIVNGLGGGALYNLNPPISGSEKQFAGAYGAVLITVDSTNLTLQFIATDGSVVDSISLQGTCKN